jgi:hypothetical protein
MFLVSNAPRFADCKYAFVDAAPDVAARVVALTRDSRIVAFQPMTRHGDMHFGGGRRGLWARGFGWSDRTRSGPWAASSN